MDQSRLQAKIYRGYQAAALRIGARCTLYRPSSTTNPIVSGNVVTTLMAAFDTNPAFTFKAPSLYAKPTWYGLFDATLALPGDYIVTPDGDTYFIASLEKTHPPLCIACNGVGTFKRPDPHPPGADYYGGDQRLQEDVLLSDWPISILQGTKAERGVTQLPGDVRWVWAAVLAPHLPGVTLRDGDRLFDNLNRSFTLSSTELTNLGWRIAAAQAET